jgi:sigma-B regulation protein RsbU (phosphoserine phosphatase)
MVDRFKGPGRFATSRSAAIDMAATTSRLRRHALAYIVLAGLFLLTVTSLVQDVYEGLDLLRHASDYARPPFRLGDANWGAVNVEAEAGAAGMKFGDAVLAVNGRPVDGFFVYYGTLRQARPGDRLRVQVQSPGDANPVRELSIDLRSYASDAEPPGLSDYVEFGLRVIVLPVVCIALGFWVAAVRIGDRSAWLLLVLLLSFTALGAGGPQGMFGREGVFQPLLAGFTVFRGQMLAPALLLFGIAFPERLPLDRRLPWLKWIVVGYLVLVASIASIGVALWTHHLALARQLTERPIQLLTGVEGDFGGAVSFVALLASAASLGWKAIAAPSPDARRRLRLLFVGAIPGVVALLTFLVAGRLEYPLPAWSILPLFTMLLAFPLTMAYVIVVYRAMDVRVAIRQGLQYVLARSGIRAIQIILLVAVSVAAASLLSGGAGAARVTLVVAGIAAIAAISGRFAARLRGWVDRRFFREAYEADAILSDLASRVRTVVETGPLLETVATRIAESLHVPRVAILLDASGTFQPAYALGYPATPHAAIAPDSVTVQRLRKDQHALARFEDPDSWVQLTSGAERRALEALQPELLLPLSLNEKVLGIMSLGPKQSEQPFSKTDLRLLDSVAAQTGLALENSRLTAAVAAEMAARAKQTRDIEIARDVQQRLFPQDYPAIPGLDYSGMCRPALGVGGDYYDFIPLPAGHLGIAIGDVSGKGVPAALLMATLRAYLRGAQTIHHQSDLTVLMANLNRLVYESSAANRYATFFYGEFDPASGALAYVNGGHNAPMLFRAGRNQEMLRLETGGPVVGLMEDCCYQQGRVTLERSDVLVAYTDGVSEAMNAADDEWGEDRLKDTVEPKRETAARDLIDEVMRAADAFVAGAPQHDDMTLVVLRRL